MSVTRRIIGHYTFDNSATVEIIATGDVLTERSLDMVEALVRLKRDELDLNKKAPTHLKTASG